MGIWLDGILGVLPQERINRRTDELRAVTNKGGYVPSLSPLDRVHHAWRKSVRDAKRSAYGHIRSVAGITLDSTKIPTR